MSRIEAVIFDWAGTTVDYGCFAPVQAFKDAFNNYGLEPTFFPNKLLSPTTSKTSS